LLVEFIANLFKQKLPKEIDPEEKNLDDKEE
jgi:hypothetical protein